MIDAAAERWLSRGMSRQEFGGFAGAIRIECITCDCRFSQRTTAVLEVFLLQNACGMRKRHADTTRNLCWAVANIWLAHSRD